MLRLLAGKTLHGDGDDLQFASFRHLLFYYYCLANKNKFNNTISIMFYLILFTQTIAIMETLLAGILVSLINKYLLNNLGG